MKKFFNIKIIYLFLFMQPILDLITSWMSRYTELPVTAGILARTTFMGYIFIYALFIYRPKEKIYKMLRITLTMIFIYIAIFMANVLINKGSIYLISEIKGIIKVYYLPIVLIGLFIFNKQDKINISNQFLNNILLIYTSIIVIATITGTYYRSYNDYMYNVGSIGWFFSANETGSLIGILMPFTIINFIQNKSNITNVISILFCIIVALYVGTKVPFLAFIGSIVLIFIHTLIKSIQNRKIQKPIVLLSGITLIFCIFFYNSPIYKNIEFNYGPMIKNIIVELKSKDDKLQESIKENNESEDKIDEVIMDPEMGGETNTIIETNPHINEEDVLNALLSNRKTFLAEVKNRYNNGSTTEKLIGLGHMIVDIKPGINTDKTIELDFYDIIYRQGIVGSLLYFIPLILIMGINLIEIIKKPIKLMNTNIFISSISILLGVGIAGVSGHVLTAPGVSIFIIIPIIMLHNKLIYGDDEDENFNNNANI